MTGITRYIFKQLSLGMIFVSLALACVLWLSQSLRLIELIVTRGISVFTFLDLTALLMPSFLSVIFPISLFAVTLFTYVKLTSDRELVVMRAVGLSNWSLARPALLLACLVAVVGYVLTLWMVPASVRNFREMQWTIKNDLSNLLLQEGAFNKFGDGLTIYVRTRSADGELMGILVHDRRKREKPVTYMAERGALVFSDDGPRVLMVNGNRQVLEANGRLSLLYFDSYAFDMHSSAGRKEQRSQDAREMSVTDLIDLPSDSGLSPLDYRKSMVELHQRFTTPLNNVTFTMSALAILLSVSFNRRGQTVSILQAVAGMICLQALTLGASNLATGNLLFAPLMYGVAVLPLALSIWILIKPPRLKRS